MKKILFMVINMNVGGTEKSLLSLLNELPADQYEITILMLEKRGGLIESIPSHVHIEVLPGYDKVKKIVNNPPLSLSLDCIKNRELLHGVKLLFYHLKSKVEGSRFSYIEYALTNLPKKHKRYDLAIAYAGPMEFITSYILTKIDAKKKAQWLHFDLSKVSFNEKYARKVYPNYDRVFVVSEAVKRQLTGVLLSNAIDIKVFRNITSRESVCEQSVVGTGFDDCFSGTRILTVGRLTIEKGHDYAILALKRLLYEGYNVKWYCIGDGDCKGLYKEKISELGIDESFVLMGSKTNPYVYMSECDIYVQPSRHEGYCITIDEAMCFTAPIVSTDFLGVEKRLEHGKNALVVNADEYRIYHAVKQLMDNTDLYQKISRNLLVNKVDFRDDIDLLLDLL